MEACLKDHNGVLPGKTIFFCISKAHARRVEEIFDSLYPEHKGELAKVVVSEDPRVYGKGGLLDQFKSNDMPRVAISVDMLDTGIDIRELVNLVFVKPVYSYTKFWQMIGRGTRLLESSKPKPWCIEKDKFLIIDCWDNFEYFKLNPTGKEPTTQIPLPIRLVGLRLDKIEQAIDRNQPAIAEREIVKLRKQINDLPSASVVIKDAAPALARLNDDNFWVNLTHEKIEFLRNEIKPLFRTLSDTDFKAMRFERDVVEYSLARLREDQTLSEAHKDTLIAQIGELPLSISFVQVEAPLIRDVQKNQFWADADEDSYDALITKLGPLMKFRESMVGPGLTHLDLTDIIQTREMVEFGPQHESISISRYKEMVETLIAELIEQNPILQKMKSGQSVTNEEAQQLADLLHEQHPHITEDLLRQVYHNRKARFMQFIRHILGLEILKSFPEAVSEAFAHFIQQHTTLSSRQLEFLNLLKTFLIDREKVDKKDLINAPFTVIHPQGIRGVFSPSEINDILQLTERLAG
jgi:type I restriction enzyme R subunit